MAKFKSALNKAFSSKFYPAVTAIAVLLCYYLGWDLVSIYYLGFSIILMCLFSDDLTPLICVFLFLGILVSKKNSPSFKAEESDFYMRPYVLAQVATVIALIVISMIVRTVLTAKQGKFKLTPVFWSFYAFACVLLINGFFSDTYSFSDMGYGFALAFLFLGVFAVLKDNIVPGEKLFGKISWYFLIFSITLVIELIVLFLTEDIFTADGYNRSKISFGWGIHNTMGMYLLISIPPVMLSACRHKRGYIFYIYGILLTLCAIMTLSRQAMLGAAVIFPICMIILLIKGKNRKINLIITAVCAVIAIAGLIVLRDKIFPALKGMISGLFNDDGSFNGNQRLSIWTQAMERFKSAPVFGAGFFMEVTQDEGVVGLSFIPAMYHNTFMQLLGACGVFGLIAYIVHRVFTVISFSKNVTLERSFIALAIFILLFVNLFDNHLFYLFPTSVYSALIAVLVKTQSKT